MTLAESIRTCFAKYGTLEGRASRSEYWFFSLFNLLAVVAIYLVAGGLGVATLGAAGSLLLGGLGLLGFLGLGGLLAGIFEIVMIIPHWTVSVRRLHDSDKSGWWLLWGLLPGVGGLIVLILMLLPSSVGPNRFGARWN